MKYSLWGRDELGREFLAHANTRPEMIEGAQSLAQDWDYIEYEFNAHSGIRETEVIIDHGKLLQQQQ